MLLQVHHASQQHILTSQQVLQGADDTIMVVVLFDSVQLSCIYDKSNQLSSV